MRNDILLLKAGDLHITDTGDILLTDSIQKNFPTTGNLSVRQAVLIRLRWFFAEWRFSPQAGFPYFEEVLIKNPNIPKIKGLLE